MTFEVDINGRARTMAIERVGPVDAAGGRLRVRVDGRVAEVDVRRTDIGLTLLFEDGRSVDAALTGTAGGEWLVQLPHVDVTALVDGRRRRPGADASADRPGEQRLKAPMPGRVVRILVKQGDEVAARQGLVVVEAMKMENELASPKAGRVKEIAVTEGVSVDAGRVLVVIE